MFYQVLDKLLISFGDSSDTFKLACLNSPHFSFFTSGSSNTFSHLTFLFAIWPIDFEVMGILGIYTQSTPPRPRCNFLLVPIPNHYNPQIISVPKIEVSNIQERKSTYNQKCQNPAPQ